MRTIPITELDPDQQADVLLDAAGYDTQWAAAIFLLTAGCRWSFTRDDRIRRHMWVTVSDVDPSVVRLDSLDIPAMVVERGWSGAESTMVRAAGALFNGETSCDLSELGRIDDFNEQAILEAIEICHRRRPLSQAHAAAIRQHVVFRAVSA